MSHYVSVTIDLQIYDVEAFVAAARERAVADGVDPEDMGEYTADNLTACAIMLLDPGTSPPGCDIQGSSAEDSTQLLG